MPSSFPQFSQSYQSSIDEQHLDTQPMSSRYMEAENLPARDPVGLEVVYRPPGDHKVDIIFVHGLGGGSQKTWSKDGNLDTFWPHKWLPYEAGANEARISTFGYDASFTKSENRSLMQFSEISKVLLYNLKYASLGSEQGRKHSGIGEVREITPLSICEAKFNITTETHYLHSPLTGWAYSERSIPARAKSSRV